MAVQQTGLTQLGNALQQGASDYANIQLRRQAEERARAQQIADLQDQRQYSESQRSRERDQRIDDATIQVLLSEGWLKPTDIRDTQAIQAAADARQARLNATREREGKLPDRLQQEADYLGEQEAQLAAAEAALNATLSAPQPAPPSTAEVRNLAIRKTGKKVPSDAEINEMMPIAAEEIMNQRYLRWSMDKEDAKVQIPLLRSQRMALRQSLGGLLQQGFVPNRTPPPPPAAALSMPAPQARVATPEERAAAAGITAPTSAPTAAASQNYTYPAASVFGLAERSGLTGSDFTAERFGQAPMNILAAPGRAIDTAGRYGGAALQGILTGDYSVPQTGLVTQAGQALGSLFSPTIEPGDYMGKERARLLNLPRSPDPLPPMQPIQRKSPAFQFGNEYAPGY